MFFSLGIKVSADEIKWNRNFYSPNYNAISNNGKIFIAVADNGLISISKNKDATDWKTIKTNYNEHLLYAVYNGRIFVVGGSNGIILTSNDGYNWTKQKTNTKSWFTSISWNGKMFLAIASLSTGWGGQIYTSTDGVKWKLQKTIKEDDLQSVYWNGEQFNIYGQLWKTDKNIAVTTKDGKLFNQRLNTDKRKRFNNMIWDGKRYFSTDLNGIISSADGIKWDKTNLNFGDLSENTIYNVPGHVNAGVKAIGYCNGKYIAAGTQGVIYTSDDGVAWTPLYEKNNVVFTSIVYGKNIYVTVRADGYIYISKDSVDWRIVNSEPVCEFGKIIWTGESFYAIGNRGYIAKSNDGVNWDYIQTDIPACLYDILWDGNNLLAVGNFYDGKTSHSIIYKSDNGTDWTNILIDDVDINDRIEGIAWNQKRYVAICDDAVLYSDDGGNWHKSDTNRNHYNYITCINSKFYAISYDSIYISDDGLKWKKVYSNLKLINGKWTLVYSDKKYILVGEEKHLYVSKDGIKWGSIDIDTEENIYAAVSNGQKIVAVGWELIEQISISKLLLNSK